MACILGPDMAIAAEKCRPNICYLLRPFPTMRYHEIRPSCSEIFIDMHSKNVGSKFQRYTFGAQEFCDKNFSRDADLTIAEYIFIIPSFVLNYLQTLNQIIVNNVLSNIYRKDALSLSLSLSLSRLFSAPKLIKFTQRCAHTHIGYNPKKKSAFIKSYDVPCA